MLRKRYMLTLFMLSVGCGFILSSNSKIYAVANNDQNTNSYIDERLYLKSLEDTDPLLIEEEIKKSIKSSKINQMISQDEKIDYKEYYKDTIFIGDSITEFISEANLLPKNNVYAKKGNIVSKVNDDIEKLKYSNPDRIFMLFGMNDVTYFQNVEDFKKEYIKVIKSIHEFLPNAKIYLQSPTLIMEKAVDKKSGFTNENLLLYQDIVKNIAVENDCTYIDLMGLISSGDYYEQDGIHFKYNFYESLFKYLRSYIEEER